ncbi:MAG: cbb3-type cytochrome c oxidase subunit I, partial [Gemmatimonadales bacterium]
MSNPHSSHDVPQQSFLRKYVFSLDHKVIGRQYLDLSLVAVTTGMILSWLMRLHLGWPTKAIPFLGAISPEAAGGIITPEYYLSLMTMHGTIMVFFVLTTAPFAGFGNF